VRDTEVTGVPHGERSEALECAQLAAAFRPASSLAGKAALAGPGDVGTISVMARLPASKLAGEKAAARCTHSKASLLSP